MAENKAKGVRVRDVDFPQSVDPSEQGRVRVTVDNSDLAIPPFDDDSCVSEYQGYKAEGVVIGPDGEEFVGDEVCVPVSGLLATTQKTSEVTFTAPDYDGSHQYEAFARLVESGEETGSRTARVDVYGTPSDAPTEPPEDDPDGSDSGVDLPEWPTAGDGGGGQLQVILGVVVVVGIAYALGNLFDIGIGYGGGR